MVEEELDKVPVGGACPNMLTRLSTFLGLSSGASLMEEALCGAGGGPRLVEPIEEVEGDFLMGEAVLEEEGGENSVSELSGGGGGNSGDCGATTPPGCHFGFALTAGGLWGVELLEEGTEEEFPGN